MKLSEFQYELPKELIAQAPLKERDTARLMVLDRYSGSISIRSFKDITEYIDAGDCVVFNDTRVVPVRFYGRRKTGGNVEIFIINPWEKDLQALIRPSKRIKEGEILELERGIRVTVKGRASAGRYIGLNASLDDILEQGHVPLPPYITRDDNAEDREAYQTVYAKTPGATAAPTAGLHFTEGILEEISKKGAKKAYVTLHTSYGTFAPVTEENIEDHSIHTEYYEINGDAARIVNDTRANGKKVIAVGTTSVRVLETVARGGQHTAASSGKTDIFIYPGYEFRTVDRILTNFHLPGSTLLMLISAFAGRETALKAYERAIKERFRFFSYGDAMLIV